MHDKNGKPVKEGDKVLIEAVIEKTFATEDFCNVQLAIGKDKGENRADNVHATVILNSRQVELIET